MPFSSFPGSSSKYYCAYEHAFAHVDVCEDKHAVVLACDSHFMLKALLLTREAFIPAHWLLAHISYHEGAIFPLSNR